MLISCNNKPEIVINSVFHLSSSVFYCVTLILRVKHPNILQLVDVFETKKEYFLFLEL